MQIKLPNSYIPVSTVSLHQISLYNGWQFIGPPAIGYLEKVSPFPSSLSSSRGGSTHGPRRNNLILKGSLEISDVVAHPLMEIVLQLEYVVTWSGVATSQAPTAALRNRTNVNAKVCLNPFLPDYSLLNSMLCHCLDPFQPHYDPHSELGGVAAVSNGCVPRRWLSGFR